MSRAKTSITELPSMVTGLGWEFPFQRELTLEPLIRFWQQASESDDSLRSRLAQTLAKEAASVPELAGPIESMAPIKRHADLVEALMTAVFPAVFWEHEYAAALIPFDLRTFYATPAFERDLLGDDGKLRGRLNVDRDTLVRFRLLNAYALALSRIHGICFLVDDPIIFTAEDRETGLDRHFKINFEGRFIEVEPVTPPAPLPPELRARFESGAGDFQALASVFPPGSVRFRGFTVLRALDVTDQEVLSSLKRDLIDKESIVSASRFDALQVKLRTLLRRPDIRLGVSAFAGDRVLSLNYGARLDHCCIFTDSKRHKRSDLAGSIYQRATVEGKPVFVEDLSEHPARTAIEDELLANGVRSIAVAPLHYQGEAIGTLSLSSSRPGDLNPLQKPRLQEVMPLFSMAVKRSMDELESRVQAFIKEKCTAIHPVVEWRFRKAALESFERNEASPGSTEIGPIVFPDVYPLYAIADIRGSSTQRAWSIQADLLTQLGLGRAVLRAAHDRRPLPILDQLTHRLDTYANGIEVDLRSGDEVAVISFLRTEIESLFEHLRTFGPEVAQAIEAYRSALDPRLGTVYAKRREFDESVTLITDAISAYIDLEEQAAQAMYPHYFEKQQTDGVDYSIYVGGSLVPDGVFDPLYLKNLRLWQLMVACGIALRADRLKEKLRTPLEITNLILVQHTPLAIRFRFDEKRFDVDGAYNVRYEIIKKRIDKAVIRGTTERLTQPGKIALVYSHSTEALEWREYIEYLQKLGYLTREVEELELDALQGAQGLRALRVAVDLTNGDPDTLAATSFASATPSP